MNETPQIYNGSAPLNATYSSNQKPVTEAGINMNALIGKQHLYAAYYETREGFMLVPMGRLTMQPDGTITGHKHPNEGSWVPYPHGTVSADKAFAFLTENNDWIPSSAWQQTVLGMPVGFFCDEPERLQKFCLVPQDNSTKSHVIYLVASCLRFYEHTLPRVLKELADEGIEKDRIKVVINGCERNEDKVVDGISYAFSTHNAWEWSALYEAPLRWQFDYAMLIHDTNFIFPGFKNKVEHFNRHLYWDYLPATPLARCLLGLYSFDFLERLNGWLTSINGIDKQNGILAEVAGELLHRAKTVLVMSDPDNDGAASQAEWRETVDIFNTGSPRVRRVFPAINLHKFLHTDSTHEHSL